MPFVCLMSENNSSGVTAGVQDMLQASGLSLQLLLSIQIPSFLDRPQALCAQLTSIAPTASQS